MFANALFWFVMAFVFAAIEVESEGKYGWAEKAPTWYRTTGRVARVYGFFMNGKPLTGYHCFMFFLPVLIFHTGFVLGAPWSWAAEMRILALLAAWCSVWDYLWFIINPAYGIEGFHRENVWWYARSRWLFNRLPVDYLVNWVLSIILAALGGLSCLYQHLVTLLYFLFMIMVLICVVSPFRFWRVWMLMRDDRDKADIFHN
ncbi:MAG: hypothetical protein C3F02_03450 [Parcubacteria group bacterium]|nr:MAG: hypothetical protein C3F02_03450 [Parcubacteria group bacterium]